MLEDPTIKLLLQVGGLIATSFGGGFAVSQVLGRRLVALLKTEKDQLRQEFDRLKDYPDRVSRLEAEKAGAERRRDDLQSELAKLKADLEAALAGMNSGAPQTIEELEKRLAKYDALREALLGTEDELWRLRGVVAPPDYATRMAQSRLRVLTIANLKGGVGKTTLVANLMAYFAIRHRKRVLAIDFDYQGSLTRMVTLGANLPLGASILADSLLSGNVDGKWIAQSSREIGGTLPGCRLITCGQIFDRFENRTQLQWLLGDTADDVRFRLASVLLDPATQNSFDIVLIDAPPRLSLGAVNALCASHAIIVPTVLDQLSVDAVGRFLGRASQTFRPLNPALEHAGIVGTITKQTNLLAHEQRAMDDAKRGLAQWHGKSHVFQRNIPHVAALSRAAGMEIGYVGREKNSIRPIFDDLGQEIVEKFALWPNK